MNEPGLEEHQTGETGTRARWLGLALIVLLLCVLVWQAFEAGLAGDELPEPEAMRSSRGGQTSLIDMLAGIDTARLSAQAASAAAPARAASADANTNTKAHAATDEAEVCGLGRVKADDAGQPRDMAPLRQAGLRVREQVLPQLLASSDEATRAAGLLVQSWAAAEGDDGSAPPAAQARDTLALMAASSRSPQVYAWALRACQSQRSVGSCQMLSADQWARLEPDNAMAWLQAAADAQVRRDGAAVAEAMYRVSLATRSDARSAAVLPLVLARLPADAGVLGRAVFALELARAEGRAELPLVAASQYCSAQDVRDANRQQVCAAVAELLHTRGSTQAEASLGAAVGQRVGWPAERVAAAADERDAIAGLAQVSPPDGPWSCATLVKTVAQLTDAGRQGELVALRAALKRSPEGTAALAVRHRQAVAARAASAPAESASASVPASGPNAYASIPRQP